MEALTPDSSGTSSRLGRLDLGALLEDEGAPLGALGPSRLLLLLNRPWLSRLLACTTTIRAGPLCRHTRFAGVEALSRSLLPGAAPKESCIA